MLVACYSVILGKIVTMNRFVFGMSLLVCMLSFGQSQNLVNTVKNQFNLTYDLTIADSPISARNLFRSNDALMERYLQYVTRQNPTWYLNYFNRNAMQRYGWQNHWELYQERFLVWSDWLQNSFRWNTIFDWNKPRKLFQFLTPAISPLQTYNRAYFRDNWVIQRRMDRLLDNDTREERYAIKNEENKAPRQNTSNPKQTLSSLVRELKSRNVAVESHTRRAFIPRDKRDVIYNRNRVQAQGMAKGRQSQSAQNYRQNKSSEQGARSYSPSQYNGPARSVVPSSSSTAMTKPGGNGASSSAAREQ